MPDSRNDKAKARLPLKQMKQKFRLKLLKTKANPEMDETYKKKGVQVEQVAGKNWDAIAG